MLSLLLFGVPIVLCESYYNWFCCLFFFFRFLRNPTELKSIKNISLLRTQPPPPLPASSKLSEPQSMSNGATAAQQLNAHLAVQSLLHQQTPQSPRVTALNGAFHYLTTSAVPERHSPPQSHSSQSDMDDMPTDLSTGVRSSNKADCYPWVRYTPLTYWPFRTQLSMWHLLIIFVFFKFTD